MTSGLHIISAFYIDRFPHFSSFKSFTTNIAFFVVLTQPVTILATAFANPDNLIKEIFSLAA